jgi:hypothetical protein
MDGNQLHHGFLWEKNLQVHQSPMFEVSSGRSMHEKDPKTRIFQKACEITQEKEC